MKQLLVFVVFQILLSGCPVYDPPTKSGGVYIENMSNTPVYILLSCGDSISKYYELAKYDFWTGNTKDENGKPKTDTIYPNYRIEAHDKHFVVFNQSGNKRTTGCSDNILRIFFITEKTIREKSWDEIAEKQLYVKKIILTQKELDDCGWTVRFDTPIN
jgi:hypothetical protein